MAFEIKYNDEVYSVKDPDGDFKDWTVVKQESYKLGKRELILNKFKEDFPQFEINDYDELTNTCSRSSAFTEWLINANLVYADQAQTPLFLKDIVEPTKFQSLQKDLTDINKIISVSSIKKRKLADKYKVDLKVLDDEEKSSVNKVKKKDKYLKVLSINSTSLPFTLQLQIERYVPKDSENVQESRDVFAREILINYKRMLCKIVKDDPNVDIDAIITSNLLK
jgi:hypothetical protein